MNHLWRFLAATAVLILAASVGAKVSVTEEPMAPKLINPSFEVAGEASDRAAAWSRWGDWFNREDSWTPVRTGHCILGYHHWEIPNANDSGLYQDVTGAVKGTSYTFGIYASADKAKDASHDAVSIELRLESTVDTHQTTIVSKLYKVADMPPDAWQKLTVTGAPTNDTFRVLVIVTPSPENGTRGGALRFDDAFLELAQ
jgi:hypothetical protein